MSNPTLSWSALGPYTFSIAGTNPTVAELLAGLNAVLVAHGSLWVVSYYDAATGNLEIKRAGSQSGELATVRILIFGGTASIPHANALAGGHSAGVTTSLYGTLSVDAATTGPTTQFSAGAPYASKHTRGGSITPAGSLVAAQTPKITLYESDTAWGFSIGDALVMCSYFGGKIINRYSDDSLLWANMPSGGIITYASLTPSGMNQAVAHPLTPLSVVSNAIKATYWDGAAARQFGRIISGIIATTDSALGASGASMMLLPVPVGESAQAVSQAPSFLGILRQMRMGPRGTHLEQMRDGSSVLQATHVLGGTDVSLGVWLDTVQ